jgi:hypothetical protein
LEPAQYDRQIDGGRFSSGFLFLEDLLGDFGTDRRRHILEVWLMTLPTATFTLQLLVVELLTNMFDTLLESRLVLVRAISHNMVGFTTSMATMAFTQHGGRLEVARGEFLL